MKNDIILKQNESSSIDCLKAMRNLYSQAKKIAFTEFTFGVLLVLVIAIIKIFIHNHLLSQISLLYGFLGIIIVKFLHNKEEKKKKLAAKMQQLFDNYLFQFDWNDASCGNKPTWEEIHKYSLNKPDTNLKDWYDKSINNLKLPEASLLCMRMNVKYDQSLREGYFKMIKGIFCIILLSLSVIGYILNKSICDFIFYYILPIAPFIIWYCDFSYQCENNIKDLNSISKTIDTALTKVEHGKELDQNKLRQIQNQMFNLRLSNFAIPNWYYDLKRKKNESESNYAIENFIKNLKK